MKLAVLAEVLPPAPFYGHVVLLYRMLKDLDPDDYCLISDKSYESDPSTGIPNSTPRLPARYHYLKPDSARAEWEPKDQSEDVIGSGGGSERSTIDTLRSKTPDWLKPRAARWLLRRALTARSLVLGSVACLRRARGVARVVEKEGCDAIVACSGDPLDLPAGYLAARLARLPFYAYLFDDYRYQWKSTAYRHLARILEPICVRGAAGVIVTNEFVRDEYRCRYPGVEPVIVRNAFEVPEIEGEASPQENGHRGKILYTGTIYQAHYDAFRNLLAALRRLDPPDVELHLYTRQGREELEEEGVGGPEVVLHEHLAASEVFGAQLEADVLFFPLAFNSPIPEVIKTSSPGKMGEYLASGRPILVHAPAGSFLDWYFARHECGVVVNERDPDALAQAIQRLKNDPDLRERIGHNARARAKADFDLAPAQEAFVSVFRAETRS